MTTSLGTPWAVSAECDLDDMDDVGFVVDGEAVCDGDAEVPIAARTRSQMRGVDDGSRVEAPGMGGNGSLIAGSVCCVREMNDGLVVEA